MIFGIASGLATAVMQSTSYVCSRVFIHRHKSAVALAVYSQLLMGLMAAFVFLFVADDFHFPATPGNLRLLAGLVLSTAAGQVCFFSGGCGNRGLAPVLPDRPEDHRARAALSVRAA